MRWPLENIPPFKKGDRRTLLTSAEANELVTAINALRRMEVVRGDSDDVVKSHEKIIIQIKRTSGDGTNTGSGVSYMGTWDDATAYEVGSIVRKKTGTMQGVYIAREAAAAGVEPTYPESGPWDLFNFGVIEYEETADDLDGTLRTIYVNASDRL